MAAINGRRRKKRRPIMQNRTNTAAHRAHVTSEPWCGLMSAWASWRRTRRLKATARILHGLSDRTLKDIGVERSEIDSVVTLRSNGPWAGRRPMEF
jgi:uncharacterized protein YjiS (DUF1127 family)